MLEGSGMIFWLDEFSDFRSLHNRACYYMESDGIHEATRVVKGMAGREFWYFLCDKHEADRESTPLLRKLTIIGG